MPFPFPISISIIPGGAEKHVLMSDILFLSVKEHAGKLVKNEGFQSGTGVLATLTANSGKDMYIARAKITFFHNALTKTSVADEVVLDINGTVVETSKATLGMDSGGSGKVTHTYEFKNIGHKVAGTQVIKLQVITLDIDTDVEGFIECFEETTGQSPFQQSEFS